jgi:CPA2 family monovalent cation:H+ antiporter-2
MHHVPPMRATLVAALTLALGCGVAARAHDDDAMAALAEDDRAGPAVMGEREIALGIARFALLRLGVKAPVAQRTIEVLRSRGPAGLTPCWRGALSGT